ncbi:hypothetical protein [Acetobacterium bakii]|uniref:DUF7973 domain-containing protein n=1 Tax=Acetobacterium bakii TaxID=52689 RepID=A0A0L6U417_9FIRM|nr:hypothetical protein [Acetobacterium bakii]KNZ43253.1 hypothetical protein AKG39_02085 [Acetobacterium bakii]
MDITLLIAAFGGGLFAAAIGGVPSFIFTGLTVIAAILAGDFGAPAIGIVSFGSMFSPAIAFAGAVAAAGYAKKIGKLEVGADIVTPLAGLKDGSVLIVGGIFGMIGYVLNFVLGQLIGVNIFGFAGWTDTVAFSVLISAILVRLIFTKSGLTGKTPEGVKRHYLPQGSDLTFTLVAGAGFGILVGGVVAAFGNMAVAGSAEAAYIFSQMGGFAFGISAFGLIFACMGLPFYACHHIFLPAASTAIIIYAGTLNPVAAILGGAITGLLAALFGEFVLLTFNSHADSHIDPPAFTISVVQLINFSLLAVIFPSIM